MRTITSACFGFALAISAFGLISRPASAVEAPAVTATAPNNVIRVHDDDWQDYRKREHEERKREHEERKRWKHEEHEARKHSDRCEHVRYECSERYDYSRHEFFECVERHDCEG